MPLTPALSLKGRGSCGSGSGQRMSEHIQMTRGKAGMITERLPGWFKVRIEAGPHYRRIQSLVREKGLHTICEEGALSQQMGMLE